MGRRGRGLAGICVLTLGACAAPAAAAVPTTVSVQGAIPATAPVLVPSTITRAHGWVFSDVATTDVDGDGRRDVVALDPQRRGVVLARSLGSGRFATRRLARLFRLVTGGQLAIGDLDRDGYPDLVTMGYPDLAAMGSRRVLVVQVAYGTRRGFSRGRSIGVVAGESASAGIAVGDADGDRRPDVMVGLNHAEGHRRRPGDGVIVLRGRPGRRFAARVRPTALRGGMDRGGPAPQLLAGDLDGDGALDLVFRGALVRGLARGRFAAPVALAPGSGVASYSIARTLVAREGRLDVVGAHLSDAVERLGVVTRGARPLRPAVVTRLQPRTDDDSVTIRVLGRVGSIAAGRLRDGPGFDVVLAGGDVIWLTQTRDGTRFTAAVPTIIPGGAESIALADLDGDRRADVVSAGARGRLVLLRNAGPKPLARPVLPPTAPLISADGTAYPVVSCTPGAGACIGSLYVLDRLLRLRLAPGATARVRINTGAANQPGIETLLRWQSPLIGAESPLTLTEPSPADRAGACAPAPRSRVLARGRDFVLIRDRDYVTGAPDFRISICSTVTGGRTPLQDEDDVVAPPIAAFEDFVATLRDVCPGGFEECIAGLHVQSVPGLATVTAFVVGTGVDAVAVGAQGALAWIACPSAEEFDPTCHGGPYDVYRLDARGRRRVGGGRRIDPRSLRTSPDGLGFTWKDAGRIRTSHWVGPPPRTLAAPPYEPSG